MRECSLTYSKDSSDQLTSYIKARQMDFEIFKTARYIQGTDFIIKKNIPIKVDMISPVCCNWWGCGIEVVMEEETG